MTGKQHGSLARAGKVRGQTPKVEKQDKKKKKAGRAKRRIQYNRCVCCHCIALFTLLFRSFGCARKKSLAACMSFMKQQIYSTISRSIALFLTVG